MTAGTAGGVQRWWRAADKAKLCIAVLALAVALAMLAPYAFWLLKSWFAPAAGASLAGWLARRRKLDAVLYAVAHAAADWIEPGVAPQLLACATLSMLVLTCRPKTSLLVGGCVLGAIVLGMGLKQRFAGSPLTWQDVRFFMLQFGDNIGVMATQKTLAGYAMLSLLGAAAVVALCWRLDGPALPAASRIGRCAAPLFAMLIVVWAGVELDAAAQKMRERGALLWSGNWRWGPVSTFLATTKASPRPQVPVVDTAALRQAARARIEAQSPSASARADILVFLQESQFNPATWRDCPRELCEVDAFKAQNDSVSFGPLRVHVFGGGTWLSEFAMATGVPHTIFGPAGDFAPFTVAPGVRRSFIKSLRAAGYRAVAVYPVRGGMMNARLAYQGYGFDAFYDAEDLGLQGWQSTDAQMHETASRVLEKERQYGKPVFLITVTIFNHAEHGIKMHRVPAGLVSLAARQVARQEEADAMADYVWRTREFGDAIARTTDRWLRGPRPMVVAWFGDHQPPFGNALGLRERVVSAARGPVTFPARFQTWYQVVTNTSNAARTRQPTPLDITFLPGLLAQAAGAPLDEWLAANIETRERCKGLLLECADRRSRDAYLSYLVHELRAFDIP